MKRARTAIAAVVAARVAASAAPAAAQDASAPEPEPEPSDWSLQLEAGSEYDSNVHRQERREGEAVDIDGAPLVRLGVRHRLSWRRTGRERLTLASHGGLKLFTTDSGQTENVAVLAADGTYEWNLPSRGAVLGLIGSYYDAIPYELSNHADPLFYEHRFFRTGMGEASFTLLGSGGHRVSAVGGYRLFHYKPDPLLDWKGEHVGVIYQGTFWRGDPDRDDGAASVDVSAGYRVERRGYDDGARTSTCADEDSPATTCTGSTSLERADLNHSLALEAVYTGRRIYSARYELQVNDSNSFGETLVRQRLRLGFTTELFSDLYLTAEATALVYFYLDPLLVLRDDQTPTFVSIDEENRNSLSAHLSRPFGRSWALEGRYAIYSNEFTNQELTFRRQTVYLGVVYRYDR
ncbi:MAG TPA: hypothetical protein VKB80_09625 [Kofleriaceae bacterium]|nr:hypothetical protein [Kofleriaceae bacterium]